ncbi:MAG: DUF1549 domain-containing protein [Limisphaerales bacterium]
MQRALTLTAGIALSLLSFGEAAWAVEAVEAEVVWARKVQPLFDVQCSKCHGLIERKGGLELDSPEAVLKGGDEGPVVTPGDPGRSRLYEVLAAGSDPHMPPKKQLSDADREAVREWIVALGASSEENGGRSNPGKSGTEFGTVTDAIDFWVTEGWRRAGVTPARGVDDRAWCRRLYLDLAGRIPTPAELSAFLGWPEEWRRRQLVERLLTSEEYPVRMRELWDVFLMGRVKRDSHEDRRRQNGWWDFLEAAFRSNRPWDQVVHDLLTARPANPAHQGAAWFLYERRNNHQAIAEAVAPVVYGAKIDCAQCHDHPLAREIKQGHYWGLVAAFNRGKNVDGRPEVAESAVGGFVNFTNLKKESQPALVMLLNGPTIDEVRPAGDAKESDTDDLYLDPKAKARVPRFSRREAFADAALRDNPLPGRAFVNRMWAVLLGRGLVHPVDEMTARNAPSHPELLDWLAGDFQAHQGDMRRLIRGIVLSRVYGLDASAGAEMVPPPETFAAAIERPLTAEQMARSWRVAAGLPPDDVALRRAVASALPDVLPVEYNATFQQAQFLTHSAGLSAILKPEPGNTAGRLTTLSDDRSRVEEAFQRVLGRMPDVEETERFAGYLAERTGATAEAVDDILWALMTNSEFLTMP